MSKPEETTQEKHEKTIIVNTRPKPWAEKDISFAQVVSLASQMDNLQVDLIGSSRSRTAKGMIRRRRVTMTEGDSVHVKDGNGVRCHRN